MINETFQIVSYSFQPRRPRVQHKNVVTDQVREKGVSPDADKKENPALLPAFIECETSNGPETNLIELTEEDKKTVEALKKRDLEVRQHEQAHIAAAGTYATGLTYAYKTGADGKRYAVGGHVDIDTSEVPNNPDATIAKAITIRRAANAPAEPSAQDHQVSAAATSMETKARAEKIKKILEDNEENSRQRTDMAITAYGQSKFDIGKQINKTI